GDVGEVVAAEMVWSRVTYVAAGLCHDGWRRLVLWRDGDDVDLVEGVVEVRRVVVEAGGRPEIAGSWGRRRIPVMAAGTLMGRGR
ncbi:hypothetical protein Tco_0165838, partial [Tanacetum coccineum]